jgi:hypothetical protein
MKHFSKIITLIFLVLPLNAYAGEVCFSNKAIHHENRFKDCSEGDVITVTTIVSTKSFDSYDDTQDGIMHLNEVSKYCSYENEIVELGEVEVRGYKTKIYSCIHIGKSRDSRLLE